MKEKTALIAGASGLIGNGLLHLLLKERECYISEKKKDPFGPFFFSLLSLLPQNMITRINVNVFACNST